MREQALALRRRPFERTSEEVFEVRLGSDIERLLPPELLALHPSRPAPRLRAPPGRGTAPSSTLSVARTSAAADR
jgi:hypothetical protein